MAKNTTTASASKSSETTAAADASDGTTVAAPKVPAIAQKEVDALVDTLMNKEVTDAAVYKLDQRINAALEELTRLKQAKARLTGEAADDDDDEEEAAPQRRQQRAPRKQAAENGGNRPDHGSAIMKAIGSGDLSKAQIREKLAKMEHEISDSILSTYLSNMTKSKLLKQNLVSPRRATYKKA